VLTKTVKLEAYSQSVENYVFVYQFTNLLTLGVDIKYYTEPIILSLFIHY